MIINHSDALTVFSCLLFLKKQLFKGHQTSVFKETFLDLKASNGRSGLTQRYQQNYMRKVPGKFYHVVPQVRKNKLRGDVKDVKTSHKNRKLNV